LQFGETPFQREYRAVWTRHRENSVFAYSAKAKALQILELKTSPLHSSGYAVESACSDSVSRKAFGRYLFERWCRGTGNLPLDCRASGDAFNPALQLLNGFGGSHVILKLEPVDVVTREVTGKAIKAVRPDLAAWVSIFVCGIGAPHLAVAVYRARFCDQHSKVERLF